MNTQEEFDTGEGYPVDEPVAKTIARLALLEDTARMRAALAQARVEAATNDTSAKQLPADMVYAANRHTRRKGAWQARKAMQQQAKRDRKSQKRGQR